MVPRYKKLGRQLGHKVPDPGAHLLHAAVGVLRKRRKKGVDFGHYTERPGKKPATDTSNP